MILDATVVEQAIRFPTDLSLLYEAREFSEQIIDTLCRQPGQDYLQRIPIEGKFGQDKNGYRLNYIRAKRANTSFAWINTIFLVMNLLIQQRIFFGLSKCRLADLMRALVDVWEQMVLTQTRSVLLSRPACTCLWLIY